MKKGFIILFLFTTTLLNSYGQEFRAGYQLGYSYYSGFEELREFQELLITYDPLHLYPEIVANYPPWFTHSAFLGIHAGSGYHIGLTGSFFSTGAKNSYADYSGTYGLETTATGYMLGLTQKYGIIEKPGQQKLFHAYLQIIIGGIFSKLQMEQSIKIDDYEDSENLFWKAKGFYIEPGFGIKVRILNWLEGDLLLCYMINPGSKLKSEEYPYDPLETWEGNVQINWTGVQIKIGMNVLLNTKSEKDQD